MGHLTEELKAKLREAGLWRQFNVRRDEIAAEQGITKTRANEQALFEILGPEGGDPIPGAPVPVGEKAKPKAPPAAKLSKEDYGDLTKVNIREVVMWVFNHAPVADVTVKDAPSPGAWDMLTWVRTGRENRTEFYRSFLSKLMPTRTQLDKDAEFDDDGGRVLKDIDKKLREIAEAVSGQKVDAEGADGSSS